MSTRVRVLLVEDSAADAALILAQLRRAGFDPEWRRVQTEAEYLNLLGAGFEVILADYQLQSFGAVRGLEFLQQRGLRIPFIVVSGAISEREAVEIMNRGAAECLLKDRLARLGPAVAQALELSRLRDAKSRIEATLNESEERRSRTILVVDDEAEVAEMLAEMLAAEGHEVETAPDGAKALEKLLSRSYDLVFCDMRMPVLDGPGLYRQVERLRPELVHRWIFLTGDTLGRETAAFLEGAHTPTMMKPFGPADLRRALSKIDEQR